MVDHGADVISIDADAETFDVEQYDPDALDFLQLITFIMDDPRLSFGARTLYAILVKYANISKQQRAAEEEGIKVRKVWPRRKLLADDMGCSRDTVDRYTKELVAAKIITVKPKYRTTDAGKRTRTSNRYILHDRKMLRAARLDRGLPATPESKVKAEWEGADPEDIEYEADHAAALGTRPAFVVGAPDVGGPGAWRHR